MSTDLYGSECQLHKDRQIRLLRLSSAVNKTDHVVVQLEVVDVDEVEGSYEALSYCWGTEARKQEILCNDDPFTVTQNLYQALVCLRREAQDRLLWIDAICIDQGSLEERASQVQLMGDIYKQCSGVVAWLGPDPHTDSVDLFFKLAEGSTTPTKMHVSEEWKQAYDGAGTNREVFSTEPSNSPSNPELSLETLEGTVAIMHRAWWSRLWIIQELALPPSVTVMCGELTLSWTQLRNGFMTALASFVEQAPTEFEKTQSVSRHFMDHYFSIVYSRVGITRPADKSNSLLSSDLANLLQNHRWSAASDPRDKVYGLLGLADSAHGIIPRYDEPVTACYTKVAFSIIQQSGNLDILQSVGRPSCISTSLHGLPSWVPDWSYDLESIPNQNRAVDFSNPMHREIWTSTQDSMHGNLIPPKQASGPEIKGFSPRLGSDGTRLVLQGYVVDSAKTVGNTLDGSLASLHEIPDDNRGKFHKAFNDFGHMGKVINTIREWDRIAQRHSGIRKGSGETEEEAYLVTLLKNNIATTIDRPERLQQVRTAKSLLARKSALEKTLRKLNLHAWQPKLYNTMAGVRFETSTSEHDLIGLGSAIINLVWAIDQKFGVTEGNYLAMLPASTKKGDKITLLKGAKTPFVLRQRQDAWEMVGSCYVHGMMSGEAWDDESCRDMELC